jgi:predicted lipoprotein
MDACMSKSLLILSLAATLALPGCRIVRTPTGEEQAADPITAQAAETFATELIPHLDATALTLADLRSALDEGLDVAGEAHGHRGAGQGAAWNFAVRGEGTVIAANLESRARKLDLDTDGDGTADATLQIGPVITGTALRDVAPFYDFGDFRDQIEFAALGRALNDLATGGITLPEGDIVGATVAFTGAMPLRSVTDDFVVTAISVQVTP